MFSFYGSKSKVVNSYTDPIYPEVIEPFAGSARYALKYWDRSVTIVDKDPVIIAVWQYLQSATAKDIISLPDVPNATELIKIEGFTQLCQEEKWLIGFCSNGGSATPKNFSGRHNFNSWNRDKERISNSLYRIRHWAIILGDYSSIPNRKATWFIDPPYQDKGKWYREHKIDYGALGDWCQERLGQVIVCENMGADWLPFRHLKDVAFTHFKTEADKSKRTAEAIWYKEEAWK